MNDKNSLAHTKWNCKYHIVFAAKYSRKVFYRKMRVEIGKILRELCNWKKVKSGRCQINICLEALLVLEPYRRLRKTTS